MTASSRYQSHDVTREVRADGSLLMRSNHPLSDVAPSTGTWLHRWAETTGDAIFLAERSGAGWRTETYAACLEQVRAIGAGLLARGYNAQTPIMILSGNSVDHGILTLAAQYIGVPTVPVAEQYSLIEGAHRRLAEVIHLIAPKAVFVDDADRYAKALDMDIFDTIEVFATTPGGQKATPFSALATAGANTAHGPADAAFATVGPDTVAKILMTSGSTSSPKGVLTTHSMMCTNQAQIADALPFLRTRPPKIMDWLPWNHVFGGSHNFNMMLANGGSLYIDNGKPVTGLFERTVENLNLVTGTLAFNVPVGFSMLLEALQADAALANRFFGELDMIFYAGASLPQDIWSGLEALANAAGGEMPLVTSSWGLTETAPAALMQHQPTDQSGIVGVPLNGVEVKLLPEDDNRFEVRIKGPNIMKGYYKNPEKTAESFDKEGFFITGDAMSFVDATDDNMGMRFEGRLSEDFKLSTGTWVRAANLRLEVLDCLAPFAGDVVITGHDRDHVGVMIFPNMAAVAKFDTRTNDGALVGADLHAAIAAPLQARAATVTGSSSQIERALVVSDPASIADGEITAKGNLNFRKILTLRKRLLERLYNDADPATLVIK